MANIYTTEIRKATSNLWFFAALGIGCLLATASFAGNAVHDIAEARNQLPLIDVSYMMLSPLSCFKYWMVTDYLQPASDLFFLLLPLLAVLPYAWSFSLERKSGSIKNALTRTSRASYFKAKYLAVFVSGGLVVAAPIALNLILCACTMPAYMTDIDAVLYVGINAEALWSEVYYNAPVLYCLMFILLDFAFAGLWASVVMSLSFFIKNRIALMIAPFLFLIFMKFVEGNLLVRDSNVGLTPFNYLRGTNTQFFTSNEVILVEFALFAVIVLAVTIVSYRKDVL